MGLESQTVPLRETHQLPRILNHTVCVCDHVCMFVCLIMCTFIYQDLIVTLSLDEID